MVRVWKEREAWIVRIATKCERTIWSKATMRSARAKLIKILRTLFAKSSNFVQETPQIQKLAARMCGFTFVCGGEERSGRHFAGIRKGSETILEL